MNTYKTNNDMTQSTNTATPQHTQPAISTSSRSTTKDIIYIGLLSALCIVFTTIKVPLPTGAMVAFLTSSWAIPNTPYSPS